MNMTLIPTPDGTDSLYAISADEWIAINDRVTAVINASTIAAEITLYIPTYAALLSACSLWRSTTFPGLISQAVLVSQFGTQAAGTLQQLSGDLVGLKPDDPVPASIDFIFTVQFGALAMTAGTIQDTVDALTPQLDDFVAQNQSADAALAEIIASLPPGWSSLAGPLDALNTALLAVQGSWRSIAAELQAAASGGVTITTAGLLASDIAGAIAAWTALSRAASSFDAMATNLT